MKCIAIFIKLNTSCRRKTLHVIAIMEESSAGTMANGSRHGVSADQVLAGKEPREDTWPLAQAAEPVLPALVFSAAITTSPVVTRR
ncbi:hypothetical protein AB4Y40_40630 [Paraburkholderia sp. EG287B]